LLSVTAANHREFTASSDGTVAMPFVSTLLNSAVMEHVTENYRYQNEISF